MEVIEGITSWVTENEALLSGLAALIAIAAIFPAVVSPMRRLRAREGNASAAHRRSALEGSGRPRIGVLPLAVVDGAPEARTESELLQRELTTLLARSDGCEVISSAACEAYAAGGGTSAGARDTLGIDYVVEGEVRSAAEGFRVTASLVDTKSQRILWSETFEVSASSESALSSRLAAQVASHLGIEIVRSEVGRARTRPRSRESRDLMLQAQGLLFAEGHHRSTYERAIALLEKATARTPDYAEAYGLMALLYALGNVFGFFERSEAFHEKVFAICQKAMELDDRSSEVLGFVGCAYCDLRQYDKGVPLLDRAIDHNPSNAQARAAMGAALHGLERYEESASRLEEALALSPAYKGIAPWATVLANSYLELGRLEEASEALTRATRCDPSFFPAAPHRRSARSAPGKRRSGGAASRRGAPPATRPRGARPERCGEAVADGAGALFGLIRGRRRVAPRRSCPCGSGRTRSPGGSARFPGRHASAASRGRTAR